MHCGMLTAFSEGKDKGSIFSLSLPVISLDQLNTERRQSGTVAFSGPATPSAKKAKGVALSILIVDDDETTLMILARLLGSKHNIRTAKSLADARTLTSSLPPNTLDLLICDMGLPDGYGADLLPQLRRMGHSKLQGIGLSGFGREEDIQRTLSAGFCIHLVKPISRAEVENAIQKVFVQPCVVLAGAYE
jgi:CheY-like chemotaxis protein